MGSRTRYGAAAVCKRHSPRRPYTASPGDLVAGNIVVTVDENGHGTINGFLGLQPLSFALQTDPGPGGLPNVLTYSLVSPPGLTAGDVLILEPGDALGDVVCFNPAKGVPMAAWAAWFSTRKPRLSIALQIPLLLPAHFTQIP